MKAYALIGVLSVALVLLVIVPMVAQVGATFVHIADAMPQTYAHQGSK
jgi:hypothetical protein